RRTGELRARGVRRWIYDQRAARRSHGRKGPDRVSIRRCPARGRARWPGAAARAPSLFLEEREVGQTASSSRAGGSRLLGSEWLSHPRRSVAGATLHRRRMSSSPVPPPPRITWRTATVVDTVWETRTARTLTLEVPEWPGHRAGQHVDVRLTAEDGYQTERSYSLASAPEDPPALTVERLDDGEVSPYLVDEVVPGDRFELRGPVGGYFVWDADALPEPLLLVAGGSGVVPLMAMLRHRAAAGSNVPTT